MKESKTEIGSCKPVWASLDGLGALICIACPQECILILQTGEVIKKAALMPVMEEEK